jgi:pyrimidine deaminase RibD-like protein
MLGWRSGAKADAYQNHTDRPTSIIRNAAFWLQTTKHRLFLVLEKAVVDKRDIEFMKLAISWANGCQPIKESIPKVGAVIAFGQEVIGRGRRGTGQEGDDEHAEWHAIEQVKNKSLLAQATLYTTLEPCTQEVRSKPLECCTELIRQHQIKRVFIGILDPNQGVTGKGLWHLQNAGVEVDLFPHDLSKEIRIQNAAFIRSQQTLGATIVAPSNGDELRTYETGGKHPIRFKCLNPPEVRTDSSWNLPGGGNACKR